MKKKAILASIAIILLFLAAQFLQKEFHHEVVVTPVIVDTAVDAVPAVINVRSDYTFTLSSEERGRVIQSKLDLGTPIEQGELLLEIDPTDLEIDIEITEADIENLEARIALKAGEKAALRQREEDLQNYERLFEAGSYPELEMKRRRREFEVFKESQLSTRLNEAQQLDELKNKLKILKRRLQKTKIYAPTDGIVTQIFAYPGELVTSGSPLAEVFSQAVVVEARINEENFAGVQEGLETTVRLLTYGNRLFEGRVARVLPTADKETQQYTVMVDLEIEESLLLPGLSGEASIIRRKIPDALIIPRRAPVGNFVFRVENERAILTPVTIGVRGLQKVEIKEGLNENDLIVTDGMAGLKDGDSIRVAD